jgi:hypothetical protein
MATVPDLTRPADPDFSAYPPPAPPAAADVATELEEFRRYLDKQITRGIGNVSIDAVLAEFRLYQDETRRLREALQSALESSRRGEGQPWNKEEMWAEVRQRLAAKGIHLNDDPQGQG